MTLLIPCGRMNEPQSITSLPESPDAERHHRMRNYAIAMTIRVACVIACFFVHGWWLLLPLSGAVLLPYIAVVLANVAGKTSGTVERPGSIVLSGAVPRREVGK